MDGGQWTPASRQGYNLRDAIARYTLQVWFKGSGHSPSPCVIHLDLHIPGYAIPLTDLLRCHSKKSIKKQKLV
jgi:hypothetical protein